MKTPLIINFTPTGMIPHKDMTPHVPITAEEIITDCILAIDLGASILHLHARNEDGTPSCDPEEFRKIILGIREVNKDVIICVTTSGRNVSEFEQRSAVLDLEGDAKPDMASLTLSSLNFNKTASVNSPEMIQKLAAKMKEKGIKPELEVFDLGMVNYAHYLIKKGLIEPPYYFNLLFGNIACAQANMLSIGAVINELPQGAIYSLAGIGDFQKDMNALAVIYAPAVRVGLEDNIYFCPKRSTLATNEELVKRVVTVAQTLDRPIATPKQAREMLGL